ncbi:hypothetical protein NTJ28_001088 [Flavobacterium psychrophilum]|nr:hypothetical protein [Flavobacterium psychrophilum]EKT4509814.1 hypothetical protein [Flavobacterium psychrophilum]
MSDITKKEIIVSPDYYFAAQKKTLEHRVSEIKLTNEEEEEIIAKKTTKTIRDKALGLFKVGEIINTVLNWNEEIDNDLKEAKKEYLLAAYFDKTDETESSISMLKQLLTSPQGNTIFNKILRILDNTPPDVELTENLAKVLKHIVQSDFNGLFEDHKFALNQIEMLTPQALTILSDYKNWPSFPLGTFSAMEGKITSPWLPNFIEKYTTLKRITDPKLKVKIMHSMEDLLKNRYIEAKQTTIKGISAVFLNDIGRLITNYI